MAEMERRKRGSGSSIRLCGALYEPYISAGNISKSGLLLGFRRRREKIIGKPPTGEFGGPGGKRKPHTVGVDDHF